MSEGGSPMPGHESTDVSLRPVVAGAAFLLVLVLAAVASMWVFFGALGDSEAARGVSQNPLREEVRRLPPEPRLQALPLVDLQELRRAESERLDSYGWIDRPAGVVHIPIERAMRAMAGDGAPRGGIR